MSDAHAHAPYDALLLLSFGGPEGEDDVVPFLENVTRGRGIPKERLVEVGRHYFLFGGVSPINAQNRELLQKLSEQTGGRYYKPDEASKLANEISYSEAGITSRETRDLWDMPIVFLLLLSLRAGEWLLRRKWGVI